MIRERSDSGAQKRTRVDKLTPTATLSTEH